MVRAIFLLLLCNLSAQSSQSIFLILNQYDNNSRSIDSSLNANFEGALFQFTEPVQELIADLEAEQYPAAARMGLVKRIGLEYDVEYIVNNQIKRNNNRLFLEGRVFSTRSGGLVLRRKIDLMNYRNGDLNELNLWVGQIIDLVYPGWIENREKILFLDPSDITYEKTPMGAAMRSLFVPGWGQAYSGKKFSSIFWAGLELSLSTAIILSYIGYDNAVKNFLQYKKQYDETDDVKEIASFRSLASKEHANHIKYNKLIISFAAATGTTWIANSVHAWVVGPRPSLKIYRKWDSTKTIAN
tara:strand:+ start:3712 stop:4608 length:897 start_codon:yes stop_codon:yes gene_type:complete